jgi:hypothetical protein
MTHRSAAAALTLAWCLALPAVALADVPPADGGVNQDCTVISQTQSGETCQQCVVQGGSDSACQDELGADYLYVCNYSASIQIWCNGPDRNASQAAGCAVRAAPLAREGGGALVALASVAAAALAMRRRRLGHP